MNNQLLFDPAVFIVGENYEIIFVTKNKGVGFIKIGEIEYYDTNCGIVRSESKIHKVYIPKSELDTAKEYTVCYAYMAVHECYYAKNDPPIEKTYKFIPVPEDKMPEIAFISDTHSAIDPPAACADAMHFDLLILGGDLSNSSDTEDEIFCLYRLAQKITHGNLPIVYARGNHDNRGRMAGHLTDYIPTDNGNTFYTFEAGKLEGIVLDCGEDKPDFCIEYGMTADYVSFRQKQTNFLRKLKISNPNPGDKRRIAICHIAFTRSNADCVAFMSEIYKEWINILSDIGIDLLISGHFHETAVLANGGCGWIDAMPDFTTVIGATANDDPKNNREWHPDEFCASHYSFDEDRLCIEFLNSKGNLCFSESINLN